MAVYLPRDSATMLAVAPKQEAELWGVAEYLLAQVVDLLAGANWQRAGKKSAPKPKPVNRPTVAKANAEQSDKGFDSVDEFRAWYEIQPGGR